MLLTVLLTVQVLLLSGGLMMYQGPTAGLLPWFSQQLGYCHAPQLHGSVSDWALDLVAVGFAKPKVRASAAGTCRPDAPVHTTPVHTWVCVAPVYTCAHLAVCGTAG